jgi:hypothetical protein
MQIRNENLTLIFLAILICAFFLCGFTAVCSNASLVGVFTFLIFGSLIINMSFLNCLSISKLSFFNCCRYVISEVLPWRQLLLPQYLLLELQRSSEKENKIFLKIGLTISEQVSSLREKKCLGRRKTPPKGPVCKTYYPCIISTDVCMCQGRIVVGSTGNTISRRG